jgi:hypothetical protein
MSSSTEPTSRIGAIAALFADGEEGAAVSFDGVVVQYWTEADAWTVRDPDGELLDVVQPENWRCAQALLQYVQQLAPETEGESDPEPEAWRWSQ